MITLRPEDDRDHAAVFDVVERAFGRADEARLVDRLRKVATPQISLVALENDTLVGHIFFSPVSVEGRTADPLGLAPLAVAPEEQRVGIGSALIRRGLAECRALRRQLVFVLGHRDYYPRFGFKPASEFGFYYERDVPNPSFFALALEPGGLDGPRGQVSYLPEFERL